MFLLLLPLVRKCILRASEVYMKATT
ncbi:unnamed protein product, partial [Allacma fusca]